MQFLRIIKEKADVLKQVSKSSDKSAADDAVPSSKSDKANAGGVETVDPGQEAELNSPTSSLSDSGLVKTTDCNDTAERSGADEATCETGKKDSREMTSTHPDALEATPPSLEATPPSLVSLLPRTSTRSGISALSSATPPSAVSKPRLHCQPGKEVPPDGLYLLDSQTLVNEKEVGPDIPRGLADEDLSAMRESEADPKPFQATQLQGKPLPPSDPSSW